MADSATPLKAVMTPNNKENATTSTPQNAQLDLRASSKMVFSPTPASPHFPVDASMDASMISATLDSSYFASNTEAGVATPGGSFEPAWVTVQKKAFTAWVNSKLAASNYHIDATVDAAFSDGVALIHFLQALTRKSIGRRFDLKPRTRIHRIANITLALDFLEEEELRLTSISAEDFADCNQKAILGFIWSVFIAFERSAGNGGAAKPIGNKALLSWCQDETADYDGVDITNFSAAFQDGLALLALVHHASGGADAAFEWDDAVAAEPLERLQLAFATAADNWSIPLILEAEDMVRWEPDERAVEMYVSLLYNAIMRERATAELEEGLAAAASSQLSLQAQVDLLRETVAALEAENAALCADRDGAVAALADAEIEVTSERRRREAVETLVSELQLDLQCRGDEANDLRSRLAEEQRAKDLAAQLQTDGERRISEIVSENTDLRNELASLRENEVYQTRIIELSKTELRDAVRSGETQQVRITEVERDFSAVASRLKHVYNSFSDNSKLAKVVYGNKLTVATLNGDKEGPISVRVGKTVGFERWSDRYVVLKDNFAFLFKSEGSSSPYRVVRLDNATFFPAEKGSRAWCITIHATANASDKFKNIHISAPDDDIQAEWLEELESAANFWDRTSAVAASARGQNFRTPLALAAACLVQIGLPHGMFIGPNGLNNVDPTLVAEFAEGHGPADDGGEGTSGSAGPDSCSSPVPAADAAPASPERANAAASAAAAVRAPMSPLAKLMSSPGSAHAAVVDAAARRGSIDAVAASDIRSLTASISMDDSRVMSPTYETLSEIREVAKRSANSRRRRSAHQITIKKRRESLGMTSIDETD